MQPSAFSYPTCPQQRDLSRVTVPTVPLTSVLDPKLLISDLDQDPQQEN